VKNQPVALVVKDACKCPHVDEISEGTVKIITEYYQIYLCRTME
jgi:hypothetical protein